MESHFLIMWLQFSVVGMAVLAGVFYASLVIGLALWWIAELGRLTLVSVNRHFSSHLDTTADALHRTIKSKASKKGFVQ